MLLPALNSTPIVDIQIVEDNSSEILFTVFAGAKMWVSGPNTIFVDGWYQDLGLSFFANTLKTFVLDDSLGKDVNRTTWGYLIASTAGLKSCTGGAFSGGQIPFIVCTTLPSS